MSTLHITQIKKKITTLFAEHIDKSDLSINDQEFDLKVTTRCLAAYAVYNHAACSPEDAAKSVVDGGDDNGVDAIYYSPSLKEMIIVQSKWIRDGNSEPSSGDIAKYCKGVEDLVSLNFERFNDKINKKQSLIESGISNFETRYVLIVIYTGTQGLAIHSQRIIDDLMDKLNDAGEGINENLVSFRKIDQSKIYTSLSKGLLSDPINIEIGLYHWGKITEPYGAYYGYISGEEIEKLWQDYGRKLFNKNIRDVLGKTDVNDELLLTIKNSPEKFWYFNNGITIIADSVEKSLVGGSKRDLGNFKLTNASIVNGAQTISTIGLSSTNFHENLKKVHVHSRIISLENSPADFDKDVTKANNRQNRIENKDFISQDQEQIRLREELAHEGISYNIIRSDSFTPSDKSFDVDEATIALACSSGSVTLAVQAKRELGKFYENLSKGIYKQIFNPTTTGFQLNNSVILNRLIISSINNIIGSINKRTGKDYGILVHGNRMISLIVFSKLNVSNNTLSPYDVSYVEQLTNEAFSKIKVSIYRNFPDSILGTLFKNKSKCDAIFMDSNR